MRRSMPSDPHHMHVGQRLLAATGVQRAAHGRRAASSTAASSPRSSPASASTAERTAAAHRRGSASRRARAGPGTVTCGSATSLPALRPAPASPRPRRRSQHALARAHDRAVERHQDLAVEARRPAGTSSTTAAGPGARRTTSPFSTTSACGTWQLSRQPRMLGQVARLAMHRDGDLRPHPLIHARPARRAPDGRRRGRNGRARSPPRRRAAPARSAARRSRCSLPGMMREEKITASPGSSSTCGCSSRAMRASAARGSPWLPVQISSTLSRGR